MGGGSVLPMLRIGPAKRAVGKVVHSVRSAHSYLFPCSRMNRMSGMNDFSGAFPAPAARRMNASPFVPPDSGRAIAAIFRGFYEAVGEHVAHQMPDGPDR